MLIFTLFDSIYICKQTFFRLSYAKCLERSRLTGKHLHLNIKLYITIFTRRLGIYNFNYFILHFIHIIIFSNAIIQYFR